MPFPDVHKAEVLGFELAHVDLDGAARLLLQHVVKNEEPRLVVTLNPEIVVRSLNDLALRKTLRRADLTVADGVGLLWAARREGVRLPGRVPGVELAIRIMEMGGNGLRVYFLGGKPGVAERAAATAVQRWGIEVAGVHHGYFGPGKEQEVVAAVARSRPDLVLAGLGERQEMFLDAHRNELAGKVLIGVGGTLDVLAGEAARTPEWTRRFHLEWAWRVGLDRRRWHRIPRLAQFVRFVLTGSG